jgi:hypothetical protein
MRKVTITKIIEVPETVEEVEAYCLNMPSCNLCMIKKECQAILYPSDEEILKLIQERFK